MDKVAIYCRLSEEDKNKISENDDSESITNQKEMLTQYAETHDWLIYDVYSDDDFGGGTRDRPDFNRLLKDAENKKFNIVLCKTQSRFTREIELAEKYIHYYFPIWGIRFVSIVDNIDTSIKGNKKSSQINSLVNEWYISDMSDNIKAVLTNKRMNGVFIGAFAPYGYKKDPNEKGHLIIDEYAADIVKDIFNMYINGRGRTYIARNLNERGVLSPGRYKIQNGEKYKNTSKCENAIWHDWNVSAIINNEVYIGNLVQNKAHSVSYKTKQVRPTPKTEWIRVAGTHEPIISKEIWENAQNIAKERAKHCYDKVDQTPVNIFTGKVFCGKCHSSLRTNIIKNKRYLRCSGKLYNTNSCEGTYVLYKRLYDAVLLEFQKITHEIVSIENVSQKASIFCDFEKQIEELNSQINEVNHQISEQRKYIKNLYIDKVKGVIDSDMYTELLNEFSNDEVKYQEDLNKLNRQIEIIQYNMSNRKSKLEIIKKYLDCERLTQEMVHIFIDKIYVHKKTNQNREFQLEIYWNF